MSAAYYAQFELNGGEPVATSIPATEHSVMTAHKSERAAMENMMEHFGQGAYAIVMDSYDYTNALENVLPSVRSVKTEKGGFLVLRPDSGSPVDVVLQALRAADNAFGSVINSKGYKVINGVSVIQGDGISHPAVGEILKAATKAGYSAQCVGFGMGAGLLQKVDRDTMSFATKLSHIIYTNGEDRDVMKAPKTDPNKNSLPGLLTVYPNEAGLPMVYPAAHKSSQPSIMRVVYDHGPVFGEEGQPEWDSFSKVKERVELQWNRPPKFDCVSQEIRDLIDVTREKQLKLNADSLLPTSK